MNLIFGRDEELLAWLNDRIPGGSPEYARPIGVMHKGEIGAVFSFFNFRSDGDEPVDVEMAVACDHSACMRPAVGFVVFSYPFEQLGVHRITAQTRQDNRRARRALEGVGFKHEGTLRDGNTDGSPNELYGMTRDDFYAGRLAPRGSL